MSTRMSRPTLQNTASSFPSPGWASLGWPSRNRAIRALALLGVPALLALAVPDLAWAQDEKQGEKEPPAPDAPKQERIRPSAGPLVPGGLPPGAGVPGGNAPGGNGPPPGIKGAEADRDADGGA
ncbi:MAG: hypothetical protein Q8P18_15950, partial [Pseudomonadota bacterium]|nr:hypothetical protein [Pseudomonadota bacterium]